MLALAHRTLWGVWELVFAQKAAVTIFGLVLGNVNEARQASIIDGCLVVILFVSYILCRSWYTSLPRPVGRLR